MFGWLCVFVALKCLYASRGCEGIFVYAELEPGGSFSENAATEGGASVVLRLGA